LRKTFQIRAETVRGSTANLLLLWIYVVALLRGCCKKAESKSLVGLNTVHSSRPEAVAPRDPVSARSRARLLLLWQTGQHSYACRPSAQSLERFGNAPPYSLCASRIMILGFQSARFVNLPKSTMLSILAATAADSPEPVEPRIAVCFPSGLHNKVRCLNRHALQSQWPKPCPACK